MKSCRCKLFTIAFLLLVLFSAYTMAQEKTKGTDPEKELIDSQFNEESVVLSQEKLDAALDSINSSKPLEKANSIIKLTDEFILNIDNYQDDKTEAIARLKKVIYHMRMELAHNKAYESNTGNIDKELDVRSKQLGGLNK